MKRFLVCVATVLTLTTAFARGTNVLHSAAELLRAFEDEDVYRKFDITATFVTIAKNGIAFEDETGGMYAETWALPKEQIAALRPGDRVHLTGNVNVSNTRRIFPCCWNLTRLSSGETPRPQDITGADFACGRFDYRFVRLTGTVRDAFTDEIDPGYNYLSVDCDGHSILTCDPAPQRSYAETRQLIGATVRISGICDPNPYLRRGFSGRMLQQGLKLECVSEAPPDIFDVPDLLKLKRTDPEALLRLGRHRICGRVLATWNGDRALIQAVKGKSDTKLVKVSFATPPSPSCGDTVEVSGFPGTDFYDYTLTRAVWRPATNRLVWAKPESKDVTLRTLLLDENGRKRFHPFTINRLVTVHGTIRSVSRPEYGRRAILEADGLSLPVDVGNCPGDQLADLTGCTVAVSGYLIADVEDWTPNNVFPEIKETFVAVCGPSDICVLARPPWWTPARLLALVIALALVIVAILIWNRSLKHLAERRGRELAEESVSRAEADMRTLERTRLAVELHDALSQNLTGVAMRIQAAEQYAEGARPEMTEHLQIADRTLKSCRTELKNCLWDLRSQALEESDLEAALRRTLAPHVRDIRLVIRFRIPRERVTDNTAHALLRIIRELTVNGIRHGHAATVRIAGSIEDEVLKFSVADNGSGFDPSASPGVAEGHFGLEGIRERIRQLGGTFKVESTPGRGTKATVSIRMPKEGA